MLPVASKSPGKSPGVLDKSRFAYQQDDPATATFKKKLTQFLAEFAPQKLQVCMCVCV